MSITVQCDACGKDYRVKDDLGGKKIRCKECGATMFVPEASDDLLDAADEEERMPPVIQRRTSKKKSKTGGSGFPISPWVLAAGGMVAALVVIAIVIALGKPAGAPEVAEVDFAGEDLGAASQLPWTEFTPPDGLFTLQLPGKAILLRQVRSGATLLTYRVSVNEGHLTVGIQYADFSRKVNQEQMDQVLELTMKPARGTDSDGTEVERTQLQLYGTTVNQTVIDRAQLKDKSKLRGRYIARGFHKDGVLYVLQAFGEDADLRSPDVMKFFSSFRLNEGATSQEINPAVAGKPIKSNPRTREKIEAPNAKDEAARKSSPAASKLTAVDTGPAATDENSQFVEKSPVVEKSPFVEKPRSGALEVGQKMKVQWGSSWRDVEVLEVLPDGRVKIHWVGYSSTWDEVVPRSRLKTPEEAATTK